MVSSPIERKICMYKKLLFMNLALFGILCCSCSCHIDTNNNTPKVKGAALAAKSGCRLSGVLSSNMVLQREKELPIWGFGADSDDVIYVSFMGENCSATPKEDGTWIAVLSPKPISREEQTLTVSTQKYGVVEELTGILVGDVWLVGGQSNSTLPMKTTIEYNPEFQEQVQESDLIRIYYQNETDPVSKPKTMESPQEDVIGNYLWKKASWRYVQKFSALGYHFAKEVSNYTDIPIGVVMIGRGGAALCQLMPTELAESLQAKFPPIKDPAIADMSVPIAGIYNAFIHPFTKMSIKGMIFYQGESDDYNESDYAKQLVSYVEELRKRFDENFSFYCVQLSSHGGWADEMWPDLALVRAAQTKALLSIDNAWLVSSLDIGWRAGDIGEADCAHPYNKKALGERIAHIALANEYSVSQFNTAYCPMPSQLKWEENRVLICFTGSKITLADGTGDKTIGFAISEGGEYHNTTATILDDYTISVDITKNTESIAYALFPLAYPENSNLYSVDNLPVPTFEFARYELIPNQAEWKDEINNKTPSNKNLINKLLLGIIGVLVVLLGTGTALLLPRRK